MRHMLDARLTRIEALPEAEHEWTEANNVLAGGLLYSQVESLMTGFFTNVEGKYVRGVLEYQGGAPAYRERCDEVAAAGYKGTNPWAAVLGLSPFSARRTRVSQAPNGATSWHRRAIVQVLNTTKTCQNLRPTRLTRGSLVSGRMTTRNQRVPLAPIWRREREESR